MTPEQLAQRVSELAAEACASSEGVVDIDLAVRAALDSSRPADASARPLQTTSKLQLHCGSIASSSAWGPSLALPSSLPWLVVWLVLRTVLSVVLAERWVFCKWRSGLTEKLLVALGLVKSGPTRRNEQLFHSMDDEEATEVQPPPKYSVLHPHPDANIIATLLWQVVLLAAGLHIIRAYTDDELLPRWPHAIKPNLVGVAVVGLLARAVVPRPTVESDRSQAKTEAGELDGSEHLRPPASGCGSKVRAAMAGLAFAGLSQLWQQLPQRCLSFGFLIAVLLVAVPHTSRRGRFVIAASPALLASYLVAPVMQMSSSADSLSTGLGGLLAGSIAVATTTLLLGTAAAIATGQPRSALRSSFVPLSMWSAVAGTVEWAGLGSACLWLLAHLVLGEPPEAPAFPRDQGGSKTTLHVSMGQAVSASMMSGIVALLLWLTLAALVQLVAATEPLVGVVWLSLLLSVPAALAEVSAGASGALILLCWCLQLRHLTCAFEDTVQTSSQVSPELRQHRFALHFLLDNMRSLIATALWNLIVRPVERICSKLLPTELRFYAFEAPVSDVGAELSMGVCFLLDGAAKCEPGYFVCNVGHIPEAHFPDVRATVGATLEIMKELQSEVPGFISNVLCVLPEVDPLRSKCSYAMKSLREINLSVWRSREDAMQWYASSKAHRRITSAHRDGGLQVFGNLLASLQPVKLRWQRRCRSCRAPSEGFNADQCTRCGGPTYSIPVF